MIERHCPKCAETISENEKFCRNCGFEIPQLPEIAKSKQPVPTSALWLAAILIIFGLVMAGALTVYVAVSSVGAESWGAFMAAKPEPEPPAAASNAEKANGSTAVQPEITSLVALPSTAAENDYIVLKKELLTQRSGEEIQFACAVQNISEVVCTGVGVEIELYDVAGNFIGSSSSWEYRDIQPGEVVELNFKAGNGQNINAYCLTEIGGEPVDKKDDTAGLKKETTGVDSMIRLTPEEIMRAKGNDPEGWVAQQAGKKFMIIGPFVEVSSSDDGQIRMVQIGRGDGSCYVFVLDPELFASLEKLEPDTEVCMSGVCMNFDSEPQTFVLIDGVFEN